jgi:ABC-type sulfate transport system substrate-binding protein
VNKQVAKEYKAKFPSRWTIYRISDPIFGGWAKADAKWFDPKASIMVNIERDLGGPSS